MQTKLVILTAAIVFTALIAFANVWSSDNAGPEIYRIRIQNKQGGLVQVSVDEGRCWHCVGRVTTRANSRITGFPASSYTPAGTVAAIAVHGIRIKVGQAGQGYGANQVPLIFSICPLEFRDVPRGFGGHDARSSAIHTDIHAGKSIFRNQSPYVGSPVFIETDHGLDPLPSNYVPTGGESFVIVVRRSDRVPVTIDFENRVGGSVIARYADGSNEIITQVVRPVRGIGRYDGTTYTGVGAINTNHGGVITISTAPLVADCAREGGTVETRGGFMIQPYYHVYQQKESSPQVMVIGPRDGSKPVLEGRPPLFFGCIGLAYYPDKPELSYRAQVRLGDKWCGVPALVGKIDDAFTGANAIDAVRLLLPAYDERALRQDLIREETAYLKRALSWGIKPKKGVLKLAPRKAVCPGSIVNYYVDGTLVKESNRYPYTFEWDTSTVSDGYHYVQIEVRTEGRDPSVEERQVVTLNHAD